MKTSEQNYVLQNGNLKTSIAAESENVAVEFGAALIASAAVVDGTVQGHPVRCSAMQMFFSSSEFSFNTFDTFNLPTNNSNPQMPRKAWESSDGKFVIILGQFKESNGHYGHIPAHTDIEFKLIGAVVDNSPDSPGYVSYILYGEEKKVLKVELTNPADVTSLRKILNANSRKFNVFHIYGHTSPVSVTVDCSSDKVCVIEAKN
ncbi:MAG: hypothetical protein V4736_02135, partial [Bdellovibrionota bacterium]